MSGLGTVVNVLAIIVAGGIGVMFRGKLKVPYQRLLLQAIGLFAVLLGVRGLWDSLFVMGESQLETTGTLLILFALPVGWLFGEVFRLDRAIDRLGECFRRFSEKTGQAKPQDGSKDKPAPHTADRRAAIKSAKAAAAGKPIDQLPKHTSDFDTAGKKRRLSDLPTYDLPNPRSGSLFADGFALATLLCAISAMGLRGAVTDGLHGDPKELFIKAIIDAVLVFALAAVYGSGATFGAVSVLVAEGLMTLLSLTVGDLLTPTLISHLCIVAAIITLGTGIGLCLGKRWKVINLLPAILISPLFGLIMMLIEKSAEK